MAWDYILHKRLRDICAYLWEDARDCRRLVSEAQIDSTKIIFEEPPMLRWQSVIMECEKQGTLSKLCPILLQEYPANTKLVEAVSPWMPNISGGAPQPQPEPESKAKGKAIEKVPIIVDPIYADDAESIFVTMESIRSDMTTMTRQLDELRRWRKEIAMLAAKDQSGERETEIPMDISLPLNKPPDRSNDEKNQ